MLGKLGEGVFWSVFRAGMRRKRVASKAETIPCCKGYFFARSFFPFLRRNLPASLHLRVAGLPWAGSNRRVKRQTHSPSLTGSLLAALPTLLDPHFRRTVLFISHHNAEDGALGFILNRPRGSLCAELAGLPSTLDGLPLFEGGPVGRGDLIVASLGWTEQGANFESLEDPEAPVPAINPSIPLPGSFRAFEGYAGWSAGQLEEEIREGSWAVLPPARDLLTDVTTPEDGLALWKRVMRRVGPWEGLMAEAPDDPSRN